AGNHALALDRLEAAVRLAPGNLRYGTELRQTAIAAKAFDRSVDFFAALAEAHPSSATVALGYGFALVDKLPAAFKLSQVGLAKKAMAQFERSANLEESWLARYSLGNVKIYFPRFFGYTESGIADLKRAVAESESQARRSYQALAWAALGDGYWRVGNLVEARKSWQRGQELFPGDSRLVTRLELDDSGLDRFLSQLLRPETRVATDLAEIWREGWQEACGCDPRAAQ
ncbi:MAG TPA: hypothetical protein PK413_14620, partial [Thermoanaerobaculia bacterium]|nr:hypothetical protein [Thermoanaerobaculia bacterium]